MSRYYASMNARVLTLVALLLLCGGCATETRTYSLIVRNELTTPVEVCVTKMYGPDEAGWESPEQLAAPPHPASDQTAPGAVLQPGKTATRGQFTGRFDRDRGRAILRIYAGTPTLTEMNAISSGSENRVDIPLLQGENRLAILRDEEGRIKAVRVSGAWPATQPGNP